MKTLQLTNGDLCLLRNAVTALLEKHQDKLAEPDVMYDAVVAIHNRIGRATAMHERLQALLDGD